MEQCGESHAGWEINTTRLESLAALLPSGEMGGSQQVWRVAGEC